MTEVVWLVAAHHFEWYDVLGIYKTIEAALPKWNAVRDEMVDENLRVVHMCHRDGCSPEPFETNVAELRALKPGDRCKTCSDYPVLEHWVVEE